MKTLGAWHFDIAIHGSRKQVQCKFSGKVIRGGITHFKQILAQNMGDVASCPDSAKVKRDMMKLLQEYKEKKRQKRRITGDLQNEITQSFTYNDYVDDDKEEDDKLACARYQSLEQHQFEHEQQVYKASRGTYYSEGGSSRPPNVPEMHHQQLFKQTA